MELAGRVAVVTGASSGLGRRFAVDMARAGAVVTGLARRADELRSLEQEMRLRSPQSDTVVCDVSDVEGFAGVLGEIERRRSRIDILINNAGVNEMTAPPEDFSVHRRVMETNYFAAVRGTLAVLPGMEARAAGIIVNVSSDSARAPGPREVAYAASKAALSAFTESMAWRAEKFGVHLHVLYPGWVPTAMGAGAVEAGMPRPPAMVRRSEEQVSRLLLSQMGGGAVDIDAAAVARFAPVAKALVPAIYRRSMRRTAGTTAL